MTVEPGFLRGTHDVSRDNMDYPYTAEQIHEFVQAPKMVRANTKLEVFTRGESGAGFDVNLDLLRGAYVDLRYLGKATDLTQPTTYDSSFLLAGYRVRGVGYSAVGRNNLRAKQRIAAGWHQNRLDPNLPSHEYNRHEPLTGFAPTDFGDFIEKCARLWTIDLGTAEVLL